MAIGGAKLTSPDGDVIAKGDVVQPGMAGPSITDVNTDGANKSDDQPMMEFGGQSYPAYPQGSAPGGDAGAVPDVGLDKIGEELSSVTDLLSGQPAGDMALEPGDAGYNEPEAAKPKDRGEEAAQKVGDVQNDPKKARTERVGAETTSDTENASTFVANFSFWEMGLLGILAVVAGFVFSQ